MSGVLFPKAQALPKPNVQAQSPTPPSPRSDADVASMSAEQRARFTRRRGRAWSDLSGGGATGGVSASRTLGAVART